VDKKAEARLRKQKEKAQRDGEVPTLPGAGAWAAEPQPRIMTAVSLRMHVSPARLPMPCLFKSDLNSCAAVVHCGAKQLRRA
jgi:hypothetical protein